MLAVALLFSSTPAEAGKATTIVSPVDLLLSNPCTGEQVSLTGTLTVSSDTEIRNGILHLRFQTVYDLDGVGLTSGNNYSFRSVQNHVSNMKPLVGFTGESTLVLKQRFSSQGGADNLHGDVSTHITVNANGDVTVEKADGDIECLG